MSAEQEFRDWITADFKAGKLGIENGWLVEYNDPCPSPCAGVYGCPPSCMATPVVDLWKTQRSDAEKRAEWEAEQGEPEWGVGWSATWSSRVMGFPLPSREEAEAHVRESNADPDDDMRYFLVQRTPEREPGWWLPVPDTTNHESEAKS